MKKYLFTSLLFYGMIMFGQIQTLNPKFVNSILFEADDFIGFDNIGNYYYIKNNVLFKKTESTILQYQNVSLGKIKKVDIINPLKIVLFYEDFNSVVFLDNLMNEIQ